MSIADMEKFTKKKHITLLPPTQMNIVSSVGQIDSKTDSGWKDHLNRIAEKHPESNLGKRYRRHDEVGTPYCLTIDGESKVDNCITIRDRDTMKQERISIDDAVEIVKEKLSKSISNHS